MGEKNSGKPFFEWLQSREFKELESCLENVPKIFLASRSPETVSEMQKNKETRKKWREAYLSEIWDYFKSRGLPKSHFAWHRKHLLNASEKLFCNNKFFNGDEDEDWQWGMYVTGWFVMGIISAIAIKSGDNGYQPTEISKDDLLHIYS